MAWNHMPQPQQRGSQLPSGGAPKEAVAGRSAQQNDEADQQVGGAPMRGADYPATDLPERHGDITPTLADDGEPQNWDDVVQPAEHAREAAHNQPLPEGK